MRLLLIDGFSALYRAFYAIGGLSTRLGVPTNAVFGFSRLLEQARRRWNPTHWAVVFECGLPKRRMELLAGYKANRPPMPAELRTQIPLADEYIDALKLAGVRVEGEEADDVMASLVETAHSRAESILLLTSDKDLFQLVDEKVVIAPVSGKGDVMGPPEVRAKTGVDCGQIAAWLALTGDSSDNIPGVPGVGVKTAAMLLNEYGSIEGIRNRLSEIRRPKLREALETHWSDVERNILLVKLDRTIDCGGDLERFSAQDPDIVRLRDIRRRLEFRVEEGNEPAESGDPQMDLGF